MKPTISSLFFLLILVLSAPLHAAKHNGHAQGISKQQAMEIAQQRHPGRVLAIRHKGHAYRVRILNANGEVRTIIVNAQSGKVVRRK
jgi:uncharacterized membrane protein YkoI